MRGVKFDVGGAQVAQGAGGQIITVSEQGTIVDLASQPPETQPSCSDAGGGAEMALQMTAPPDGAGE